MRHEGLLVGPAKHWASARLGPFQRLYVLHMWRAHSHAQAIRRATAQVGELDAVTTFCELAVPLASRLAEKLGMPHNTPAAVDAARDKVRS